MKKKNDRKGKKGEARRADGIDSQGTRGQSI